MAKRGRTSKSQISQVLAGLPHAVLLIDAKRLSIVQANPAAEDLTGRPRRDLSGLPFAELFSRKSLRKVATLFKAAATSARSIDTTVCHLVRPSGRKTRVVLSICHLTQARNRYWIVTIQSLAAQVRIKKERERQLREITQVSKLADIGLLTAGVAHELNNPLMIVQGFAENLDLLLDQPVIDRKEIKGQAREILMAVERMSRIIRQMTRIVRSTEVHFEITELKSVVENMTRFIAHEFRRLEIDLVVDIDESILIKCDPNQIEQVILNILSNAVHALAETTGPRRIQIRASVTKVVELTIFNNGAIIPRSVQEKLMTPFFTTKEVGKGTGLGLSISYGIMKAHGGSVRLEQSNQNGTAFKLTFPKQDSTLTQSSGVKVLVVTPDGVLADQLSERIHTFGYRVLLAHSSVESLELIKKNADIQCLFIDLSDPEVTIEVIHQMQTAGPSSPVSVALLNPQQYNSAKEAELLSEGVTAILKLPINHNSFSAIMNRIKQEPQAA